MVNQKEEFLSYFMVMGFENPSFISFSVEWLGPQIKSRKTTYAIIHGHKTSNTIDYRLMNTKHSKLQIHEHTHRYKNMRHNILQNHEHNT
jgi:hypothetical protein